MVKEFISTLKEKKMIDFVTTCETILYRSTNFLTPSKAPGKTLTNFSQFLFNTNIKNPLEKITSLENHIDLKYPFDPYSLPKSAYFIDQIYLNWKGDSKLYNDNDNSSEEEDDEDSQNSSSSLKHSTSYSDDDLAMSFTPDTAFDIDFHFNHSFK